MMKANGDNRIINYCIQICPRRGNLKSGLLVSEPARVSSLAVVCLARKYLRSSVIRRSIPRNNTLESLRLLYRLYHSDCNQCVCVCPQVRTWDRDGRQTKMCTARPGWATMSFRRGIYKNRLRNIEVNLIDILDVDIQRKVSRENPPGLSVKPN